MTQRDWTRYRRGPLVADYARAAIGLALCVTPLVLLPRLFPFLAVLFGVLTVIFGGFALHTVWRQGQAFRADERGLWRRDFLRPQGQLIPWDMVLDVKLRFFATRRDREQGWLQAKIKTAGQGTVTFDSALDDFGAIARVIAREADQRGWVFDDDTMANLAQLGLA